MMSFVEGCAIKEVLITKIYYIDRCHCIGNNVFSSITTADCDLTGVLHSQRSIIEIHYLNHDNHGDCSIRVFMNNLHTVYQLWLVEN